MSLKYSLIFQQNNWPAPLFDDFLHRAESPARPPAIQAGQAIMDRVASLRSDRHYLVGGILLQNIYNTRRYSHWFRFIARPGSCGQWQMSLIFTRLRV
jgi:hypothetical protein